MPKVALQIVVLGTHRGGNNGLPSLSVQPESSVELVANAESSIKVESHEGGRDMAGEALDYDSDFLGLYLDIVGRTEAEVRFVRDISTTHCWVSSVFKHVQVIQGAVGEGRVSQVL